MKRTKRVDRVEANRSAAGVAKVYDDVVDVKYGVFNEGDDSVFQQDRENVVADYLRFFHPDPNGLITPEFLRELGFEKFGDIFDLDEKNEDRQADYVIIDEHGQIVVSVRPYGEPGDTWNASIGDPGKDWDGDVSFPWDLSAKEMVVLLCRACYAPINQARWVKPDAEPAADGTAD